MGREKIPEATSKGLRKNVYNISTSVYDSKIPIIFCTKKKKKWKFSVHTSRIIYLYTINIFNTRSLTKPDCKPLKIITFINGIIRYTCIQEVNIFFRYDYCNPFLCTLFSHKMEIFNNGYHLKQVGLESPWL